MVKISDIYQRLYDLTTGRPTNFNWIIKGKLARSGVPMSRKEAKWLIHTQGIRIIVTKKEKPLSQEWLNYNKGTNTGADARKLIIYVLVYMTMVLHR